MAKCSTDRRSTISTQRRRVPDEALVRVLRRVFAEHVVRQQALRQLRWHVDSIARERGVDGSLTRAVLGDLVQCSGPIHPSNPGVLSTSYTHPIAGWFTWFREFAVSELLRRLINAECGGVRYGEKHRAEARRVGREHGGTLEGRGAAQRRC